MNILLKIDWSNVGSWAFAIIGLGLLAAAWYLDYRERRNK
jgi:superoxide dismutase